MGAASACTHAGDRWIAVVRLRRRPQRAVQHDHSLRAAPGRRHLGDGGLPAPRSRRAAERGPRHGRERAAHVCRQRRRVDARGVLPRRHRPRSPRLQHDPDRRPVLHAAQLQLRRSSPRPPWRPGRVVHGGGTRRRGWGVRLHVRLRWRVERPRLHPASRLQRHGLRPGVLRWPQHDHVALAGLRRRVPQRDLCHWRPGGLPRPARQLRHPRARGAEGGVGSHRRGCLGRPRERGHARLRSCRWGHALLRATQRRILGGSYRAGLDAGRSLRGSLRRRDGRAARRGHPRWAGGDPALGRHPSAHRVGDFGVARGRRSRAGV